MTALRHGAAVLAVLVAAAMPAQAGDLEVTAAETVAETVAETAAEAPASEPKRVDIAGYIRPTFGIRYRPDGVPRDRFDYGVSATATGLVLTGEPLEKVTYVLHAEVTGEIVNVIRGDAEGGGGSDDDGGIIPAFQAISPLALAADAANLASAINIEQVTIGYDPYDELGVMVGQMRIPFTVQGQSPSTALMFPTRSAPNEIFLRGSDLGALGRFTAPGGRASVRAGVFNGSGLSQTLDNERGPLYALRADVTPLGAFPAGEVDPGAGPLRVGVGAGMLYLPSTIFDESGFASMRARDLRASLSLRLAAHGFYLQAEALRRQRTDSLSSRPLVATGAYAQASYFLELAERLSLSPIARLGWTERDQAFDPRTIWWTELGASLFVRRAGSAADDLRLTLQYMGENRVTEGENAHGVITQVQLRW
jgi:hypothetical protein